ncbi:MAG: hypothetical protein LW721_07970 [Flammeovirgaceae bacterium]|jgi:hypothetical protein|nr:hypothetical protein [Flammeovirgaceae bacterium]
MIKFRFFIALILLAGTSLAQTVKVKTQQQRVKGENVDGFAVDLEGKRADVAASLAKYLKEIGKAKFLSSDPLVITDPVFNGTVYPKGSIYAFTNESGNVVTAWLGIKPTEWETKEANFINKQLERMANEFGVRFYREKMQALIDETEQAGLAVEKQALRFMNQGKDLATKLTNNGLERIKLEKALETNKFESEVLKVKIDNNKKAQDSIANVAVQINKVKQSQIEKLRKIN